MADPDTGPFPKSQTETFERLSKALEGSPLVQTIQSLVAMKEVAAPFISLTKALTHGPYPYFIAMIFNNVKESLASKHAADEQILVENSVELEAFVKLITEDKTIDSELRRKIFWALFNAYGVGLALEDRTKAITEVARAVKQAKDDSQWASLLEAVESAAAELGIPLTNSEKFALKVRPVVRERLGLPREEQGWPEITTIRKAVKELQRGQG